MKPDVTDGDSSAWDRPRFEGQPDQELEDRYQGLSIKARIRLAGRLGLGKRATEFVRERRIQGLREHPHHTLFEQVRFELSALSRIDAVDTDEMGQSAQPTVSTHFHWARNLAGAYLVMLPRCTQ